MKHEPCGLLGDSQGTHNFVGRNTVLAGYEHPKSREPFLQRDGRLFEDRPDLYGELAAAVTALPALLSLQVIGIPSLVASGSPAVRALGTLRPAHEGYGINANLFVAKVLNRLLQGLWRFHDRTISNWRGLVKSIITTTSP